MIEWISEGTRLAPLMCTDYEKALYRLVADWIWSKEHAEISAATAAAPNQHTLPVRL